MIAQEKSVSKAAEKLHTTQPALSIFLSRVEEQIGHRLFNRTSSGLTLTHEGECYITMAHKIQKAERDFEMQICSTDENYAGRLKIGTSAHIGSYTLPIVLPLFKKRYPNIEISIIENTSGVLEQMVNANELDIALLHKPFKNLRADYAVIAKDRYVAAIAKGHKLEESFYYKKGERFPYVHPEDFKGEKFILAFPHQRVRQISDIILENAGITSPDIVLTTSSVQTALRFAETGIGVTFLPESYLKLFVCVNEPNFCYMEEAYQAFWTFVLAYPKGTEISRPLEYFIELTKENYK